MRWTNYNVCAINLNTNKQVGKAEQRLERIGDLLPFDDGATEDRTAEWIRLLVLMIASSGADGWRSCDRTWGEMEGFKKWI